MPPAQPLNRHVDVLTLAGTPLDALRALCTLFTDRRFMRGTRTGRAENYHHPRMLTLNLLALDRMIARRRSPA